MKSRFSRTALILIGVFALFFASTAQASNQRITQISDFWFEITEPTVFFARTYAVNGYWSDPHLWLYDQQGVLLAANDDWYGLQSRLEYNLQPGLFRLRTGVCCGDPNRWFDGVAYDLETNTAPIQTTTTEPIATTTSLEPETTTTSSTTTTTEVPQSSTLPTWETTTTTSEPTPTTVTSTTSLPTSSSTTQTPPAPTTTTSTTTPSTTTVQSSTTTETSSPPQVTSTTSSSVSLVPSTSSVPSTTYRTTTTFPTTSSTTTTTTTTTVPVPVETAVPLSPDTSSLVSSQNLPKAKKVYVKKVGFGPIKFTIKVTEEQRQTVIAAAIVQITAVASISTIASGGSSPRSRR